jgi:hypothetical protein
LEIDNTYRLQGLLLRALQTTPTVENCIAKCGFSVVHVNSNDDSAVKLSEDEKYDWQSFRPLGVQFEDCTTCDSGLKVCGVQSADQVLDQHLTRPEEGKEIAEHKAIFLGALRGLEAARKCMCEFDTKSNIIVVCNKVEKELY